jgi:hypothetical protein
VEANGGEDYGFGAFTDSGFENSGFKVSLAVWRVRKSSLRKSTTFHAIRPPQPNIPKKTSRDKQ